MDVGISLAAVTKQYGTIEFSLGAQGFRRPDDVSFRVEKEIEGFPVYVDILYDPPQRDDSHTSADIVGIARALVHFRTITVEGLDLLGVQQKLSVRICEAGPFLAMKLRAFAKRQAPKDAFDLLYTLLNYDRGSAAAVAAFAEEVREGNPACPEAIECLRQHFGDERASAPVRAAHFVLGAAAPSESPNLREQRLRIQQDTVSAGRLLLEALSQ